MKEDANKFILISEKLAPEENQQQNIYISKLEQFELENIVKKNIHMFNIAAESCDFYDKKYDKTSKH